MRKSVILFLFSSFCLFPVYAQLPQVFLISPEHLAAKKAAYRQKDPVVVRQVDLLLVQAARALEAKPHSVVEKGFTPESGSKHDYMSMGPYWWPDPSKANGLPYIRKDGERNPEIRKITDHEYVSDLENKCRALSLAWYFTGDEKYAAKAKQLINTWFIDPDTKMNPNFDFAQAIPGINNGRGIGIIESRWFANIADWAGVLQGSKSYTAADLQALKGWYRDFLTWMLTSKNGREEQASQNNHGTFYDMQIVSFALFTGDKNQAAEILQNTRKRLVTQIAENGEQKLELERTNAYSYSNFNLSAWFSLGFLGERAGVDLWKYAPGGRGLRAALDWLLPYAVDNKPRTYQQIGNFEKSDMYPLLIIAAEKFSEPAYRRAAEKIRQENRNAIDDLLYN